MIREVERETVETETVEVRICDRCGLECEDGGRKLYWGPSISYTTEAEIRLEEGRTNPMPGLDSYSRFHAVQDAKRYVELDHNGYVRLCADCRELLFSWSDAEPRGTET
jgi:hypothetical protein